MIFANFGETFFIFSKSKSLPCYKGVCGGNDIKEFRGAGFFVNDYFLGFFAFRWVSYILIYSGIQPNGALNIWYNF